MSEFLKRKLALMIASLLTCQGFIVQTAGAEARQPTVVINEVAWAGSADSSSDEWIELYNTGDFEIDLRGWRIIDDGGSEYVIEDGEIAPKSFFVIEDREIAVSGEADVVIGISLANSGDSLVLKDADGQVVDIVNSDGAAWFAGNSGNYASMERIDPNMNGDNRDNWASADFSNGKFASTGSEILGTPGSVNSVFSGEGPMLSISPENAFVAPGKEVEFIVSVSDAEDLYAYGFELDYDDSVIHFLEAEDSNFLIGDRENVSFQAALSDGEEGKLVVAASRLMNPPTGISGNGELFSMKFLVVGEANEKSSIGFNGRSYLSDVHGEVASGFTSAKLEVSDGVVNTVKNLEAKEGENRRTIELSWEEPNGGADSYIVSKKYVNDEWLVLAEIDENYYLDTQNLMPNVNYEYRIQAKKMENISEATNTKGIDSRGLTGDNNYDDYVDGRDLERLARAFGSNLGEERYELLVDMNFDGTIDGSDLIDLGVNFANSY